MTAPYTTAEKAFVESVKYHLANTPDTYQVTKMGDRWYIVNGSGAQMRSYRTKREATADLTGGRSAADWDTNDRWYRQAFGGRKPAPYYRDFTDNEAEWVRDVYIAAGAADPVTN